MNRIGNGATSFKVGSGLQAIVRNASALILASIAMQVGAQSTGRILSGYPPGGAVDVYARIVSDELSRSLGRAFIVETKSGAGGQLAVDQLKQSKADGQTFLVAAETNMVIYPHTVRKPTYDTLKDFVPVAAVATYDIALGSKTDPKITDFASWVSLAKASTDFASFASPGAGSNMHLFGVMLGDAIGTKLQHVPYRGTGPAINDAAAGVVATVISPVGPMLQYHEAKRLRIIATSGTKRSVKLPDVPTFDELGYAKLSQTGWFGLFAPAGTPPDVVARVHSIVAEALKRPDINARVAALDMQTPALTQAEFASKVASEYQSWGATVRASGFVADGQ